MSDPDKSNLFGPLDANPSPPLPIGDNIHELSDKQLSKLVQLKFQNQPFRLVRQLSKDLASKEAELILLRKEKFQREQELMRLCMEYGNLSALEVDRHLNALPVEANAQKVVSQMIQSALDEQVGKIPVRKNNRPRHISKSSETTDPPSPQINGLPPDEALQHRKTRDASYEHEKRQRPPLVHGSSSSRVPSAETEKRSHWLDWLNPSEELITSSSSGSLNSRLRSLSLSSFRRKPQKNPVELQSIGDTDDIVVADSNTDKYGFYIDMPSSTQNDSPIFNNAAMSGDSIQAESSAMTATISLDASGTIDKLKHLGELYDAQNDEIVKRWDTFMNHVRREKLKRHKEEDSETFGARGQNLKRPESRLAKFFISGDDENSDDLPRALLRLVNESGIPPKYRNTLWFELSGAKNREVRGEFQRLVEVSQTTEDRVIKSHLEQIDLDLHRTHPSNRFFNDMSNSQPGPHLYKLQNILYAFVAFKPEIGYSQGMNKVVGNLLLGTNEGNIHSAEKLSEEDVFWIFVSLTEDFVPKYGKVEFFHPDALAYIQQDVELVQSEYFPQLLPKLYKHLKSIGVEIQMLILRWWLGLFTESFFSVELWFKLFDNLLLRESADVKFVSYSLAIFKLFEKTLLDIFDADEVYRLMSNLNMQMVSQTNIRYSEFIFISNEFERHLDAADLERKRLAFIQIPSNTP